MQGYISSFFILLFSTNFLIAAEPSEDEALRLFLEFKSTYGKNYNGYDHVKRFAIFKDNLKRIEQQNRDELGTAEYGVNQFADLTTEEFAATYANAYFDKVPYLKQADIPSLDNIPDSVDWREKGAVGPVEDQGRCGSCWSFSVVGNIEAQWYRKTGELLTLSKQQLVDCDSLDHGCHGGYPTQAYSQIRQFGGLQNASDYPYVARAQKCQMNRSEFAAHITTAVQINKDEQIQAAWVAERGPMSVCLNAFGLQFYQKGIYHPQNCRPWLINHAVLTVGFGIEKDVPYWIVKNSWGKQWGEEGYFRIFRGAGICGINRISTSAVID